MTTHLTTEERIQALEEVAEAARCYEYGGRWSMMEARERRDAALLRLGLIREVQNEHFGTDYESADPFMDLVDKGMTPGDAMRAVGA